MANSQLTQRFTPRSVFKTPAFPFPSFPSLFSDEFFTQAWPEINQQTGLSVYEDEKFVTVEAALPGLNSNEIEVSLDNSLLWIKGFKKAEQEDKRRKYFQKSSTSFSYSVALPIYINFSLAPEAVFKDGVLKIIFPKSKKSSGTSKKIPVKSKKS